MKRTYSDYFSMEACAATIVSEVIKHGISRGWCGNNADFEKVSEICNKYNVYCTDDFLGEWSYLKK